MAFFGIVFGMAKKLKAAPAEATPERTNSRWVPIDTLHADQANVRLHDEKNMQAIKDSLRQFQQVEPLTVVKSTGRVIGGNGRLAAMREMGWEEVYVTELDIDDVQATALAIALNRTGELAHWDTDALQKQLASLQSAMDLETLGFDAEELSKILSSDLDMGNMDDIGDGNEDAEGPEGTGASHVKMVQLFFNEQEYLEFFELADAAQQSLQTENLTGTVLAALRRPAA